MSSALNISKELLEELEKYMRYECNEIIDQVIREGRLQVDPEYDDKGVELDRSYVSYNHLLCYVNDSSCRSLLLKQLLKEFRDGYMDRIASFKYVPSYVDEINWGAKE